MNLYSLLTERREDILAKCRELTTEAMGARSTTYQLDKGPPTLYSELLEVLRISLDDDSPETRQRFVTDTITASASRQHAQEAYRLGYTVSQLVHGYGAICQGITQFAHEIHEPIAAAEFSQLNLCLDVAIAQSVSEFEQLGLATANRAESLRLGFLAHELRNYLTSAIMAHEMIKSGGVGASGATGDVLTNAHRQMKNIIDRAVAEVRMGSEPTVELTHLQLFSLLSEQESSALAEANAKSITLRVDADPSVFVDVDRHLMASAMANLVQNAIKYTKEGGQVWIRAYSELGDAVVEVEDRCGGLPAGKVDALFEPFVRQNADDTGLGLGLSIARRAVELNHGKLSAVDLPGTGCVFTIRLPLSVSQTSPSR